MNNSSTVVQYRLLFPHRQQHEYNEENTATVQEKRQQNDQRYGMQDCR